MNVGLKTEHQLLTEFAHTQKHLLRNYINFFSENSLFEESEKSLFILLQTKWLQESCFNFLLEACSVLCQFASDESIEKGAGIVKLQHKHNSLKSTYTIPEGLHESSKNKNPHFLRSRSSRLLVDPVGIDQVHTTST
jgi:hypothetical protein